MSKIEIIILKCPKCKTTRKTNKLDYDPPDAVTLEMRCPKCTGGDFSILYYYDLNGKEITTNPKEYYKEDE